jgi:hypothetical protein
MRKRVQPAVLSILISLAVSAIAAAASMRPMQIESLIEHSERVFYGRVLENRCVWDDATRTIWTQTRVEVLENAKGRTPSSIWISEPGGIIGDVGHLFPGVPRFWANEEVVLFLRTSPGNRLRVTGLRQGVFVVDTDLVTHSRIVRPTHSPSELVYESTTDSGQRLRAPASAQRLDEFLSEIRRKAAAR